MIATLTFTLPDDRVEFAQATNAARYYSALIAITEHVRSRLKYGEPSEETATELEELRDVLQSVGVYEMIEGVE